jgi:hypothetical protein
VNKGLLYLPAGRVGHARRSGGAVAESRMAREIAQRKRSTFNVQLLPCVKQRLLYQNHQSYPLWQGMCVEVYAMPYGGNP